MSAARPLDRVGYVMTHYPKTAQTFISGEIDAVEKAGLAVSSFAMNLPSASDLDAPGALQRRNRTRYLKANWAGAFADMLALALRHPVAMTGLAFAGLRSAGSNPARMARRMAHFVQAASVARSAKRQGIGHLHAHFGLAPATIAWLASRMMSLGGPSVPFSFTIHGFHDFVDEAEARLDIKAREAAAVVCISDYTRSQLCRLTDSALWPRFEVVRCGVDLDRLQFSGKGTHLPATILAVGRLSAEKGFAVLIEAVAMLARDNVAVNLRLVGDGPEAANLAGLVDRHGLQDRITFTGELPPEAVRAELEAADIFCLPSFNEGLPVSIMEAMAVGTPVVATWIAGIPELAENGVTALNVAPGRADTLRDALQTLVKDEALGKRLAKAARSRVEQLHDQASNGAAMARLMKDLSA